MLSSSETLNINPSLQSVLSKYQRIIGLIFTFYIFFFHLELLAISSSMQSKSLVQLWRNARKSSGVRVSRDLGIYCCCMAQCLCAMTVVFSSTFQVMHINQLERGLIWEKFQDNVDWKEPLEVFIV